MAVIECVGCGAKVNEDCTICPTCSVHPRTGQLAVVASPPVRELTPAEEEYRQIKERYKNRAPGLPKAERLRLRAEIEGFEKLHPELVPPWLGETGFLGMLIGLIVPFVGAIGLVMCIIALFQALLQKRPIGGYTIAGLVLGALEVAAWTALILQLT